MSEVGFHGESLRETRNDYPRTARVGNTSRGVFNKAVRKTPGGINSIAVGVIFFGGIFAYSAVKGESFSTAMRDVLSGKNPANDVPNTTSASVSSSPPVTGSGNLGTSSIDEASKSRYLPPGLAQALGVSMAAAYGWTGNQFSALNKLWTRESGWVNIAYNPSSGAFGIAQALPDTKYPKAGRRVPEGGKADAATQIKWGLSYIKQRYGNPVNAWNHETSQGWY